MRFENNLPKLNRDIPACSASRSSVHGCSGLLWMSAYEGQILETFDRITYL